jgi:hypothetical protein
MLIHSNHVDHTSISKGNDQMPLYYLQQIGTPNYCH